MPLNRLRQVLGQLEPDPGLFRTPGYNPSPSNAPYGQTELWDPDELPSQPAAPPGQSRLAEYIEKMSELRGERSGELRNTVQDYDEWINSQPRPSGWRTAAAIGASFLRPLRQSGVPEMLATSPEQERWRRSGTLLGERLQGEYDLEQERLKQAGELNKAIAQHASDIDKPEFNTQGAYDPRTGKLSMRLGPDESLVNQGPDGRAVEAIRNRKQITYKPTEIHRSESGAVTMPYSPEITGGNVVRATEAGGEVSLAPSEGAKNETSELLENLRGKWANIRAGTTAQGVRDAASIGAAASNYRADQSRAAAENVAKTGAESRVKAAGISAAARAKTGQLVKDAQSSVRDFSSGAKSVRDAMLRDVPNTPEELARVVGQLSSIYQEQAAHLGIAAPGLDLGIDIPSLFAQNAPVEDPWYAGPSVDREKVLAAYDQAVGQVLDALEAAGQQRLDELISQDQEIETDTIEPEEPDDASESGTGLMSQQEFIEDYKRNRKKAPTPEQIERARDKYWQ